MKTYWQIKPTRRTSSGFTLIELLIVIAIIAILAALTMGAFTFAQQAASRNRTMAAMTAIKGALERYKEKFGEYPTPVNPTEPHPTEATLYIGGARMLYQAITGDGDNAIMLKGAAGSVVSDGQIDAPELENVIDGSMPKPVIFKYSGGYYFMDGFARPFQYDIGGSAEAVNPTFDLWSFGNYDPSKPSVIGYSAAIKKDETQTGAWIKNW